MSSFIQKFEDRLQSYWKQLMKKYNCDIVKCLDIVDDVTYGSLLLETLYNTREYKLPEVVQILRDNNSDRNILTTAELMLSLSIKPKEEDPDTDIIHITPRIVMKRSSIYYLMLKNLTELDDLFKFYKVHLRHEMGHVIDYQKILSEANDWDEFRETMYGSEQPDIRAFWVSNKTGEEYHKEYNSFNIERRANEAVGLTWEDHYRASQLVNA